MINKSAATIVEARKFKTFIGTNFVKSNFPDFITCVTCAVYIGKSHRALFDKHVEHVAAMATGNR